MSSEHREKPSLIRKVLDSKALFPIELALGAGLFLFIIIDENRRSMLKKAISYPLKLKDQIRGKLN